MSPTGIAKSYVTIFTLCAYWACYFTRGMLQHRYREAAARCTAVHCVP